MRGKTGKINLGLIELRIDFFFSGKMEVFWLVVFVLSHYYYRSARYIPFFGAYSYICIFISVCFLLLWWNAQDKYLWVRKIHLDSPLAAALRPVTGGACREAPGSRDRGGARASAKALQGKSMMIRFSSYNVPPAPNSATSGVKSWYPKL